MYKIIQNNKVIDVIKTPYFVRFLPTGHVTLTDKTSAHGIIGSDDTVYSFNLNNYFDAPIVSIEKITNEEFNRLLSLLNSKQEISADESELGKAKRDKIRSLSSICKNKIIAGFSITLSDGEQYNFKLTQEDQLNLMLIENQINAGDETFIYHATDKPCRLFIREDMIRIVKAFRRYILYHTTYFNIAKQYINLLDDIEKVNSFSYGADVSEVTGNKILKQILKNGGNI